MVYNIAKYNTRTDACSHIAFAHYGIAGGDADFDYGAAGVGAIDEIVEYATVGLIAVAALHVVNQRIAEKIRVERGIIRPGVVPVDLHLARLPIIVGRPNS